MSIDHVIKKYLPGIEEAEIYGDLVVAPLPMEKLMPTCRSLYQHHSLPLKIITAFDERAASGTAGGAEAERGAGGRCGGGSFRILYVFGVPGENVFLAPAINVRECFPSLTPVIHEASIYERKIKTFFGLHPEGHPNARPLILHENWPEDAFPLRKDFDWRARPPAASGEFQFRKLGGEGIYEIPVGPVHAGIIEPGHFRFSVAGEEILLLEPRLGYSHKGTEKLFEVLPLTDKVRLAERISGDSSFSHALAFCLALEKLGSVEVSEKDQYLRVIFAELERLANHLGDMGAIMTDTGFNFGGAQGGRLREEVMQLNESLTGSRFLRGAVRIGGVAVDIDTEHKQELAAAIDRLEKDFEEVISVALASNTLINRLRNAGVLTPAIARDHGALGVAGRASGSAADARVDYPYAAYGALQPEVPTEESGDVEARFRVRLSEARASFELIRQALAALPAAGAAAQVATSDLRFKENSYAVGIVEGWRGDIVHLVATDADGEITRVDVRDPSFLNWTALGYAGFENMVPDFPLINKSFNLSYSGNDL